jgi:hypothetical protein
MGRPAQSREDFNYERTADISLSNPSYAGGGQNVFEGFMNVSVRLRMWLVPILDHAVRQAMYMVQSDRPMDAVRWLLGMNRHHISSSKVTQDVLLVGGENDTFQPVKLLYKQ